MAIRIEECHRVAVRNLIQIGELQRAAIECNALISQTGEIIVFSELDRCSFVLPFDAIFSDGHAGHIALPASVI